MISDIPSFSKSWISWMPLSIEITTKPFVKADTEWKCNSDPHGEKNIGFYNGIPVVFQHFINNRFLVEVGRAKVLRL